MAKTRHFYAFQMDGSGSAIVARFPTRSAAIAWVAAGKKAEAVYELPYPTHALIAARSALCKRAIRYGAQGLPWPQQLMWRGTILE